MSKIFRRLTKEILGFVCNAALSKDANQLGRRLADDGITGAKVIGERGTIISVDAKIISSSRSFKQLQRDYKAKISNQ